MTPQVRARLSSDVLRTLAIVISENSLPGSDLDRELLDCVRRIVGDAILNIAGDKNYKAQHACLETFHASLLREIVKDQDRALSGYCAMADTLLVSLARKGDMEAQSAIIQRTRQKLLRVARTVLDSDYDSQRFLDQVYSISFAVLPGVDLGIPIDVWLVQRTLVAARRMTEDVRLRSLRSTDPSLRNVVRFPDRNVASTSLGNALAMSGSTDGIIARTVDKMPDDQRLVLLLVAVEGLTPEASGKILSLSASAVRTRFHRAIDAIARSYLHQMSAALRELFNAVDERSLELNKQILKRLNRLMHPCQ